MGTRDWHLQNGRCQRVEVGSADGVAICRVRLGVLDEAVDVAVRRVLLDDKERAGWTVGRGGEAAILVGRSFGPAAGGRMCDEDGGEGTDSARCARHAQVAVSIGRAQADAGGIGWLDTR